MPTRAFGLKPRTRKALSGCMLTTPPTFPTNSGTTTWARMSVTRACNSQHRSWLTIRLLLPAKTTSSSTALCTEAVSPTAKAIKRSSRDSEVEKTDLLEQQLRRVLREISQYDSGTRADCSLP